MNRRAFLAWLGGTAAGVALAPTLDLEKLLWIPGEKNIFVPPPPQLSTAHALNCGDIFTIDGVFATNPITGKATRHLQNFVITSSVSSGPVTIEAVHPRIAQLPRGSRVTPRTWKSQGWASL